MLMADIICENKMLKWLVAVNSTLYKIKRIFSSGEFQVVSTIHIALRQRRLTFVCCSCVCVYIFHFLLIYLIKFCMDECAHEQIVSVAIMLTTTLHFCRAVMAQNLCRRLQQNCQLFQLSTWSLTSYFTEKHLQNWNIKKLNSEILLWRPLSLSLSHPPLCLSPLYICHVNFNRRIYLFNDFNRMASQFGALPTWSNEKSVSAEAARWTFNVSVASLCKLRSENAASNDDDGDGWCIYIFSPFAMILGQNESTLRETRRQKKWKNQIETIQMMRPTGKWMGEDDAANWRNWNTNISTKWPNWIAANKLLYFNLIIVIITFLFDWRRLRVLSLRHLPCGFVVLTVAGAITLGNWLFAAAREWMSIRTLLDFGNVLCSLARSAEPTFFTFDSHTLWWFAINMRNRAHAIQAKQ